MNPLQQYKIGFVGLSIGSHAFAFEIGPEFFVGFDTAAFEQGLVKLDLVLEKSNNMLTLHFTFNGQVELECDRCLENYMQAFALQRQLLIKFGEAYQEQSDEIVIIPSTESHIDIAQYVYEFLHLGLPVKRVHPDGPDGQPGCDKEAMMRLSAYMVKKQDGKNGSDSPFDALKHLKFNQ